MSFIVAAYYTKNTPYAEEVKGLVKSCRNFNIQCEVRSYPSRGSWCENTCIKPEFILDIMLEFPDKDIVYIDADGIVQQYPKLFDTVNADLAFHSRDGREVLSGTIYIKNNAKMILFIKCWIAMCGLNPTMVDQKTLGMTIKKYAESQNISIQNLPASYTQIYDLMRHNGAPVIEHFQASRRFKESISNTSLIPGSVCGMKTRSAGDGSFFLPRCSEQILKELETDFTKFENELRWFPKQISPRPLEDIRKYFEGKDCYIVGKGPSLDKLSKEDFPNPRLPIICINESVHKVESLDLPNKVFAMQQDAWLKDTCRPKYGSLIISYSCRYWYPDCIDKYLFHHTGLWLNTNNITVVYAIALAKMFKSTGLKLLCFDACLTNNIDYGKCIGYTPDNGGSPQRFLDHKRIILSAAGNLFIEFIPVLPALQAGGKPQLYHNSQIMHHGLFPS